jgi:hypothetical protein
MIERHPQEAILTIKVKHFVGRGTNLNLTRQGL